MTLSEPIFCRSLLPGLGDLQTYWDRKKGSWAAKTHESRILHNLSRCSMGKMMMHLFILKGVSYQCITQLSIDQFTLWFFVTERREFTADNFDHSDDLPRGFFPSFGPASTSPHFCLHFRKVLWCFQKNKNTSHHKRCNLPQLRALRAPRGRVVIFSNLRLTADSLAHQLKREGMTCRHLHGKLDQDRGRMCVVGLVVSSVF